MNNSDNPFQSPATTEFYSEPTHRSFRLTPCSDDAKQVVVAGTSRDAVRFALITQIPLLILTALIS